VGRRTAAKGVGAVRGGWLVLAAVFGFAPALRAEPPFPSPDEERAKAAAVAAEAADLFSEGRAAFEKDDLSTALDRLTRAYELAPDHRNAALLGQIELTLGDAVSAATHLDESVRRFPRDEGGESLGLVMAGLREARNQVGTLRVHSKTKGAELWVDSKHVGGLPLAHDLYVEPGRHRIEVRAAGHAHQLLVESIERGASRHLELTLLPVAEQEADEAHTPASEAARTMLFAGSALTVLGLGAGIGFELWARDAEQRAEELRVGQSCGSDGAGCVELRAQSDRAATRHDLATLSFVVSGAIGLLTAGTFAVLSSEGDVATARSSGQRMELHPWLGPETAGVGLTGGF
jgi:hypothetical protein